MNKKRIFALLCALALLISLASLAGCAKDGGASEPVEPTKPTEPADPVIDEPKQPDDTAPDGADAPSAETITVKDGDGVERFEITTADGYGHKSADGQPAVTISSADGTSYLEARFIRGDTDAESLAPSFMDGYLDFTDIDFSGVNSVGGTGLSGETITAKNDRQLFEAYLIDAQGGVLSVVMCCELEMQAEQSAALRGILDTLSLK